MPSSILVYPTKRKVLTTSNFTNTRWQMIRSDNFVEVKPPCPKVHGDPAYYKYATLPYPNDKRWSDAPTKNRQLNFDERSRLPDGSCFKKLDFTYFRAYVNIPEGTTIQQFRVTISQVDDGARMYLFNNSNVGGVYKQADDAKLNGRGVSADFTSSATPGWNMVCIVQFDDCPVHNKLTGGVEIKINNQVVVTDPQLDVPEVAFAPKKFKMETYGIFGKGRSDTTYWIGWNAKSNKPGIITNKEADSSDSYIFEIERVEVANGVALKVLNYRGGKPNESHYLPNLQTSPHVYAVKPPLEHERNLTTDHEYNFISLESVSTPNSYLRHSSFVLSNDKGDKETAVYRQDCTWHFHEIK